MPCTIEPTLFTTTTTTTKPTAAASPRPATMPAPPPGGFRGPDVTYEDAERLTGHLRRVAQAMSDEGWHTLAWLASEVGCSEASASARLRDLRRSGFDVQRQRTKTPGVWEYRAIAQVGRALGRATGVDSHAHA